MLTTLIIAFFFKKIEKALDEKEVSSLSESSYKVQNNIRNDLDVKLALDIMQCQYKMFSKDQFDSNTNSCMSDWIMLALSPMGKVLVLYY